MLSKKAEAMSFSLKELFEFILRILALLILIWFLFGLISLFIQNRALENAYNDMDRIIAELRDMQPGETLMVPVLSDSDADYSVVIRSIDFVKDHPSEGLNCRIDKGDYCSCLMKDGKTLKCTSFELKAEDGNVMKPSPSNPDIELDKEAGVILTRNENTITIQD